MHRSLKPHAQNKKITKVLPPALPGDPVPLTNSSVTAAYQKQIPVYRLGGVGGGGGVGLTSATGKDDVFVMNNMVSSPSLEEGGFNLPREPTVALRIKDELSEFATAMSTSGSSQTSVPGAGVGVGAGAGTGTGTGVACTKITPQSSNINCPTNIVPCPPPVFCAALREPLTHKAAVYYHQQLALQEDQGIDLTQSPGRDSPGSSSGSAGSGSRHSTASLDSGRASSYLTGTSGAGSIRSSSGGGGGCGGSSSSGGGGSGSGGGSGGVLSSPRCSSLSSCSIGSVDRQRNEELIIDWLMEMKYEEYAQLFIGAGYDLPTIARMTPEDLTAIGIKNPHHRERIKQKIDKLQVLDNLPHFVPGSIEEWLQLLRLEEYIQPLLEQNYKTVRDVTQVTWEDLEDIGIVKLGHQKKILLAIKRVKDIINGKWNAGGNVYHQQIENSAPILLKHNTLHRFDNMLSHREILSRLNIYTKPWQQLPPTPTYFPNGNRVSSWDDSKIFTNANISTPTTTETIDDFYYCTGNNHECCSGNDMVLIKVRQPRGKSLESLEDIHDNSTRSHLTFSHYTTTDYGHFTHPAQMLQQQHQQQQALFQQQHLLQQQQQQQQSILMQGSPVSSGGVNSSQRVLNSAAPHAMNWRRSYDDGDITPTNDAAAAAAAAANRDLIYEDGGGGTLPRQHRGGILQRAVLNTMPPLEHHHYMNAVAAAEYVCHGTGLATGTVNPSGIGGSSSASVSGSVLDNSSLTNPYLAGSPIISKKIAPEPPRRHCSIRQARTLSQDGCVPINHNTHPHMQNAFYGGMAGGASLHAAYMQQQHQQQQITNQPIYANYATIQQTTAEIHCEKLHDNKSNSSIDSIDTIPFANENTGTIKQRLLNRQELGGAVTPGPLSSNTHLHSSSSSSSSSSTNTIANITNSFHSLKTSSSLHDASLIRSESIGSTASAGGGTGGGGNNSSTIGGGATLVHLRSPTLQYPSIAADSAPSLSGFGVTAAQSQSDDEQIKSNLQQTPCSSAPSSMAVVGSGSIVASVGGGTNISNATPKVSANVLNDIGNMLANLTDELDAMLEEEKRVGLNIDSE